MENKTKSYFKYAIGEILLVMIGILLALQVNNWNQDRQNRKTLTIYTDQLVGEIDKNIGHFNLIIDAETKLSAHIDTLITLVKSKDLDNPQLINKSFALLSFEEFKPETIAYDNLKSSGEFKLIENIELRNSISAAYNTFESVALTQEVHYYNMKTRIADYFFEKANYSDLSQSAPDFGKDMQFGNLVFGASITIAQKIDACKASLEVMTKLKEQLLTYRKEEL